MITERTAAELVTLISELWPKWNPPEFQSAELADWMVRRLANVGVEEAKLALLAEAEEQHAKQFSKSQPIVKSLKARLVGLQSAATGQIQDKPRSDTETQHGGSEAVWEQCQDGQFRQGGFTADEWADSWDRLADHVAKQCPKVGPVRARQCRARAKRLRAGQFAGNPFGFTQHTGDNA